MVRRFTPPAITCPCACPPPSAHRPPTHCPTAPPQYYAPGSFNFGGSDDTQPVMDDPSLEDYNVPDVVARFNALIDDQLTFTAGSDTMIMMATDFSGENAQTWYRNIDKLIHHVNEAGKYNVLYSTPSIYTSAKIATTQLPRRDEDVMPYFDDAHAVWSGYFTSRPALKGYIRDSSRVFQTAKQLQAFAAPPADMSPSNPLYLLERAVGVTQHHDAVSGTAKQVRGEGGGGSNRRGVWVRCVCCLYMQWHRTAAAGCARVASASSVCPQQEP